MSEAPKGTMRPSSWLAICACTLAMGCDARDADPGVDGSVGAIMPRQTVTATQTLPPGEVEEGIWQASPGHYIGLFLAAASPSLDWDIHAHNNGGTQDVASAFGQSLVSYDFTPEAPGPWYLLIRNSSETTLMIDLGMELYGEATWDGFQ